ncbi:hypothetical protein [Capnocytophaga leadbetteri]|jgi:hypothetical protein|uniref:hypothetical protein n=1 Tax=Capnocytophaga leadbetteri TaxID=327575 RepID=UPI0028E38186|nr:hypothetical protein [Capnocytophaga leadbetteri]
MKRIVLLLMAVVAMGCSKSEDKVDYSDIVGVWKYKSIIKEIKYTLIVYDNGDFSLDCSKYPLVDNKYLGKVVGKEGSTYKLEIEEGRRIKSDLPAKGDIIKASLYEKGGNLWITYDGALLKSDDFELKYRL